MTLNHVRCALLLLFFTAAVLPGQPSPLVTAVVLSQQPSSPMALHEMSREADHILKKSRIVLRWHFGEPAPEVNGMLVLVKLRGRCDMDGPAAPRTAGPLGWSYEVDGTVLPFTDLDCDSIRGSVQAVMQSEHRVFLNIVLGRAMGRVLAHELYHVFADTSEHSREGVAQSALSPRQLTSGRLELQRSETGAMQTGLAATR